MCTKNDDVWQMLIEGVTTIDDEFVVHNTHGLKELAYRAWDQYIKDLDLYVEIIIQAGRDRDTKYFNSDIFLLHCKVCGLDDEYVFKLIENVWRQEDEQTSR